MKKYKTMEGKIISLKMNKTAVVEVVRYVPHKLYKKLLKRSKNFKVNKEGFELKLGDRVKISEVKPISKGKHFKITEVLK
jgi:small subunit ribosomal protein S17